MTDTLRPAPPYSGKVGVRSRPKADLSPADAKDMVVETIELLGEALREMTWMHDLGYGRTAGREVARVDQLAAAKRDREESKTIGPPTHEAWGEVPGDLASAAAANGRQRSAYQQMSKALRSARASAREILTIADKTIPEATSDGSPLPDLRADKQGKIEYAQQVAAQARRRRRGEL